jgi:hypothetical protein
MTQHCGRSILVWFACIVSALSFAPAPTSAQTTVLVSMSNLNFVGAKVCGGGSTACAETVNISFEWNVTTGSVVAGSMSTVVAGAISEPYTFANTGPVVGGQGFLWTDTNGDSVSLNTCGANCGKFPSVGSYNPSDITLLCGTAGDSCFTDGFSGSHPIKGTFTIAALNGTVLFDNFTNWTTNSTFLTDLAAASSSPPASFVAPQLSFQSGLQVTGPTEDFQTTGVQSVATFLAPFTVCARVTPIAGTANPFEIFLVSSDLTQYVTLAANVSPVFHGMWIGAPNIAPLFDLGEQFSPPFDPVLGTTYAVSISVDASGVASARVSDVKGKVLGTMSGLQSGTGPFYLVLGQRIGLAPTGPQEAVWSLVRISRP